MKALLFAGQGSQKMNMGLDFYENSKEARSFIDNLKEKDEILKVLNMDEEKLKETKNTQLALIAFQTMVSFLLRDIDFDGFSGLSIGEYSALYKSDVISIEDTIKIAKYRGQRMQEVSKKLDTSMYALMTNNYTLVEEVLKKLNTKENYGQISNINTDGQIVISGSKDILQEAVKIFKDRGIRSISLKVSGPFHTSYMDPVKEDLRDFFENIEFKPPKKSLYLNLSGQKYKGGDLKEIMAFQVASPVKFKSIIENMINDGIDTFVEIGFYNVLSKFVKKIDKNVKTYAISTYKSYEEFRSKYE